MSDIKLQTAGEARVISIDPDVVNDASSQMAKVQQQLNDEAAAVRNMSTTIADGIICKGVEQLTEAFERLQGNIETLATDAEKISKGLTDCADSAVARDSQGASYVNR